MNQNHRFGVEIEFNTNASQGQVVDALRLQGLNAADCHRTGTVADAWAVKYDGSIGRGWEIVSPVMSPDTLGQLNNVARAIAALKVAGHTVRAGSSCGLHVHLSGFGEQNTDVLRNVVRRFCNFEDTFDLMQPASRRQNTFCRSNLRQFGYGADAFRQMWERTGSCMNTDDIVRAASPTRYLKLNLQSLSRHGTVEFRQHSATVSAEKVLNWVEFLSAFVEVSASASRVWQRKPGPVAQPERFRKLMRGIPGNVMGYLTSRVMQQNGGHFPA